LYQEKGDGIEYEYSFSQAVQPGDPDSYKWITKEYMDCSAPCGGGRLFVFTTTKTVQNIEFIIKYCEFRKKQQKNNYLQNSK
jgi:hypothetical protein